MVLHLVQAGRSLGHAQPPGQTDLFPARVKSLLEEHDLLISPAVKLELQHLYESQRTAEPAATVIAALGREVGLAVCDFPFREVAEGALAQSWTRDPFDRLIVSQAALRGASLVTKDRLIQESFERAVWG